MKVVEWCEAAGRRRPCDEETQWGRWVDVRHAVHPGHKHRYYDDQVLYHYNATTRAGAVRSSSSSGTNSAGDGGGGGGGRGGGDGPDGGYVKWASIGERERIRASLRGFEKGKC